MLAGSRLVSLSGQLWRPTGVPYAPPHAEVVVTTASDAAAPAALSKFPTGIRGFDEITEGGLPKGRPTLSAAAAGCGKTLLAMEFLVRGATRVQRARRLHGFEETARGARDNVASLGFDLERLISREEARPRPRPHRTQRDRGDRRLRPRGPVRPPRHAIDAIRAKRVVLDTIEALFAGLHQRGDPARRDAAPLPLAEGQGRHRDRHRRAAARDASRATAWRSTSPTA